MELIISAFKALVAADFPKVAGLFGLIFLSLGIINNRIVLGPVAIPRRDRVGRLASLVLGFLFACVPLIQLSWGSIVALYSPPTKPSITETRSNGASLLFIGPANAAETRYKITAGQRSVLDASQMFRGKKVGLYVGDVHIKRPNTILFFNSAGQGAARIQAGTGFKEDDIRNALPAADIVFLASLTQGETRSFSVDRQKYTLTVESVIWSLLGDDSVTLSVKTEIP